MSSVYNTPQKTIPWFLLVSIDSFLTMMLHISWDSRKESLKKARGTYFLPLDFTDYFCFTRESYCFKPMHTIFLF